jgi:peptidoglycan hydrolase-like protein with peptidoglycan-binding domain
MNPHQTHVPPKLFLTGAELHPWDIGDAVSELQELLCAHGFSLRVDGDFGWRTEAAVKTYQHQNGLIPDGVVGSKTWAFLKATVKQCTRSLSQGHSGQDVLEMQELLQIQGYKVPIDGIFGTETHRAMVVFQQNHQLKDNGIVNEVTWRLLRGKKKSSPPPSQRSWLDAKKWW